MELANGFLGVAALPGLVFEIKKTKHELLVGLCRIRQAAILVSLVAHSQLPKKTSAATSVLAKSDGTTPNSVFCFLSRSIAANSQILQ